MVRLGSLIGALVAVTAASVQGSSRLLAAPVLEHGTLSSPASGQGLQRVAAMDLARLYARNEVAAERAL